MHIQKQNACIITISNNVKSKGTPTSITKVSQATQSLQFGKLLKKIRPKHPQNEKIRVLTKITTPLTLFQTIHTIRSRIRNTIERRLQMRNHRKGEEFNGGGQRRHFPMLFETLKTLNPTIGEETKKNSDLLHSWESKWK